MMSMLEHATRSPGAESQSLRSYLDSLPTEDVIRISDSIDIDYHPTALVLEFENRRQTPVVMIDRPIGFDMPVVTNLFASRDRIARMVGAEPGGFNEAWVKALANLLPARVVEIGAVQEVVRIGSEIDAATLPISRHFEKDAGRYIGSGILVCKDPDTGTRNLSYQRLQLKGPKKFGASLHSRGHIWEHLQRCEARGRNLEVAIVIGVHPAINVAAAAKVAMEIDEFEIAGALLGQPIELVKCKTIDVEVPAQAEIVIEGFSPASTRKKDPTASIPVTRPFVRPRTSLSSRQSPTGRRRSSTTSRVTRWNICFSAVPPRKRIHSCVLRKWCRGSRR